MKKLCGIDFVSVYVFAVLIFIAAAASADDSADFRNSAPIPVGWLNPDKSALNKDPVPPAAAPSAVGAARDADAVSRKSITKNQRTAIKLLNETILGADLCGKLVNGSCTEKALAAQKIEFVTEKFEGATAKIEFVDGKTLITLNQKYEKESALFWANSVGHELSHADDIKTYGVDIADPKYRLPSEIKAYLYKFRLYSELKFKYPDAYSDPTLDFMVQALDHAIGGPYPDNFEYNGQMYNGIEKTKQYIEPATNSVEALDHAVRRLFESKISFPDETSQIDRIQADMIYVTGTQAEKYTKWRQKPILYQPPPPPVTPHPVHPPHNGGGGSGGNNNGGSGSSGSGSGHNPGTYNPHFGDGI